MTTIQLFSTSTTTNPDARPVRRADSGPGYRDVVAWITAVEVDPTALSPLAAWLAQNVRSTLRSGTTVRLTSSESNSELMRREGRSEAHISRIIAAYGDEAVTIDWLFSQYDPRRQTGEQWLEREAARILRQKPARIAAIHAGCPDVEFAAPITAAAQ